MSHDRLTTVSGQRWPETVAWTLALWPLLIIHATWVMSTLGGSIEACIPYWDGCTSISRAARQTPALYLFRATLLPWGLLLAAYWLLAWHWARCIAPEMRLRRWGMLLAGLTGVLAYLLYATWLGEPGGTPQLLRRYGINLYFSTTVLAQLLLVAIASSTPRLSPGLRRAYIILFAALIGLGFASLPLQFGPWPRERLLNVIEWWYALLMIAAYPLTALAWRQSGYRLQLTIRPDTTGTPP